MQITKHELTIQAQAEKFDELQRNYDETVAEVAELKDRNEELKASVKSAEEAELEAETAYKYKLVEILNL